ncbi:MAG: hypothetical protein AAGA18_08695 [Verrucomicrobiota bacterium]
MAIRVFGIPWIFLCVATTLALSFKACAVEGKYQFDGTISRKVLENYLSRAVTHVGLCGSYPSPTTDSFDDDLRMLQSIGAKFIGRAAYIRYIMGSEEKHFREVKEAAAKIHAMDPEMVLQACISEVVSPKVRNIPIPAWAFEAFGEVVEERNFKYKFMLFDDGKHVDRWPEGSVPDMSKLETRLWFYYRARRYIDSGIEAIHFGQVALMDDADEDHTHWFDMLSRVRAYAKEHARRHLVLCDARTHGELHKGKLLFDFHSFPLRPLEVQGKPTAIKLSLQQPLTRIYGQSKGGITPSGWQCKSLPFLVEFDNWGYSGREGRSIGGIWVWGYDEISWFAVQTKSYREQWLAYALAWLKENDSNGFIQIPTRRRVDAKKKDDRITMFAANNRSEASPKGYGIENSIKMVWNQE